jgi:hypothetical protein
MKSVHIETLSQKIELHLPLKNEFFAQECLAKPGSSVQNEFGSATANKSLKIS